MTGGLSGAYFLLRILVLAVSSSVGTVARTTSFRVFIPVFVASALVMAIARPYKRNIHSISVPVWLFVMVVFTLLAPLLLLGGFVCWYFLSISRKLKRLCSSADEPNSDMEPLETLTVCDSDFRQF